MQAKSSKEEEELCEALGHACEMNGSEDRDDRSSNLLAAGAVITKRWRRIRITVGGPSPQCPLALPPVHTEKPLGRMVEESMK